MVIFHSYVYQRVNLVSFHGDVNIPLPSETVYVRPLGRIPQIPKAALCANASCGAGTSWSFQWGFLKFIELNGGSAVQHRYMIYDIMININHHN